jgi:hypothetical protein
MAVNTAYVLQNLAGGTPATTFRQAFGGVVNTGGICGAGEYAVAQSGTPAMSVQVAAGRAWVAGGYVSPPSGFTWTTQGMYSVFNDAAVTLTIATSNPTNPRIDVVYLQVQDSFYSGGTDAAILGVVTGTPAPSPTVPAIPTNAISLANIAVAANATTIVNANITNNAAVVIFASSLELLGAASQTLLYTPVSNNDTPTSGTATWFTMGNITVPTWATKCIVAYSVNGIITVATSINCTSVMKVGGVAGAVSKRIMDLGTTAGRFTFSGQDRFTGLSAGSQSVTVSATWNAGTANSYRLDTSSYVTAQFGFQQ